MLKKQWIGIFSGALLAAAGSSPAQDYPVKPVRIVVPSSPGGGTDTTARIISPKLTELLGQQVVVENRPGGSTIIGMEVVARAPADGYTLLIGNSTMIIIPSTHKKLPVDPIRDFAPITQVVALPQILVTHPSFPGRNLKELMGYAKANPGKLDYAAGALGGSGHMAMQLFLGMTGLKITYVPYKSGNAGLADVLGGQIPVMMGSVLSALPHVRAGKLRAMGVTTAKRASGANDIPTIAEGGVPGYEAIQWFGILAPAHTPAAIVSKLHGALLKTVEDPNVRKHLLNDGAEPATSRTPDEYGAYMRADLAKWAKVIRDSGMQLQ